MYSERTLGEEMAKSFRDFLHPIMLGIIGGVFFSVALERTAGALSLFMSQVPISSYDVWTIALLWIATLVLTIAVLHLARKASKYSETYMYEIERQSGLILIDQCLPHLEGILRGTSVGSTTVKHQLERLRSNFVNTRELLRSGEMKRLWDRRKITERRNQLKSIERNLTQMGFSDDRIVNPLDDLIAWFDGIIKLDEICCKAFKKEFQTRLTTKAKERMKTEARNTSVEIKEKALGRLATRCRVFFDLKTDNDLETPIECTSIYHSLTAVKGQVDVRSLVRSTLRDFVYSDEFRSLHIRPKPTIEELLMTISESLQKQEEMMYRTLSELRESPL